LKTPKSDYTWQSLIKESRTSDTKKTTLNTISDVTPTRHQLTETETTPDPRGRESEKQPPSPAPPKGRRQLRPTTAKTPTTTPTDKQLQPTTISHSTTPMDNQLQWATSILYNRAGPLERSGTPQGRGAASIPYEQKWTSIAETRSSTSE